MQYPIQLGDTWTAAQVLEQIFAGEGIDFYQNWVNGKVTDPTDPKLLDAIQVYKKIYHLCQSGQSWPFLERRD